MSGEISRAGAALASYSSDSMTMILRVPFGSTSKAGQPVGVILEGPWRRPSQRKTLRVGPIGGPSLSAVLTSRGELNTYVYGHGGYICTLIIKDVFKTVSVCF